MLKQISVKKFRILKDLSLTDLHRINLIAGLNGSGKTSLLEAAFLLTEGGNPRSFLDTDIIRAPSTDDDKIAVSTDKPWKEIFSELNWLKPIEITGHHQTHGALRLEIKLGKSRVLDVQSSRQSESAMYIKKSGNNLLEAPTLNLSYVEGTGSERKGQIQLNSHKAKVTPPAEDPSIASIFLASRIINDKEDAIRLGKLRLKKREELIVEALQVIEPQVKSVHESLATGFPTIYADVGIAELMPLPVLGDGMAHIARLVLAIATVPNGMVFADEIEYGFHHSVLPDVWKVVDRASKTFGTQIVATTHSRENIVSAHDSLDSDSFRLHRLESNENENNCVTYGPEAIDSAVEFGMEVR